MSDKTLVAGKRSVIPSGVATNVMGWPDAEHSDRTCASSLVQRWKQDRIERAPGKEGTFLQEKVVLGRYERDSPANNVALCVKLGIRDAGQMGRQVLLAHLQTPGEMNGRERLSRLGHGAHDLPAGHILGTIKVGGQTSGQSLK